MHMMASAKQLSDNLQCPICRDLLSEPKLLPCSHSFCKSCLHQLHSQECNVKISCPVCRQVAHVPGNNVSNFPNNQIAKSLAEGFKEQSDAKARRGKMHGAFSGQPCTVCDGDYQDIATYYCQNCAEFLCDHCLQQHKKYKRNTLHEVVKARAIQTGIVKIQFACPDHPQELEQFVCITCLDRICCRCLEINHTADGHEVIGMTEYEESQQQTLQFLRQKKELRSVDTQNRLSFVKEKLRMVKEIVSQRKQDIENAYDVATEQLRRRKDELLDECNTHGNTCFYELENIIVCHNDFLETISDKAALINDEVKRLRQPDLSLSEHAARVDGFETILKGEALVSLLPESTYIGHRAELLTFHRAATTSALDLGTLCVQDCELELEEEEEEEEEPEGSGEETTCLTPIEDRKVGFVSGNEQIKWASVESLSLQSQASDRAPVFAIFADFFRRLKRLGTEKPVAVE